MALKNQIVKMNSCTMNLNDLTSDPFLTPVAGKLHGQRSFTTSTPYKHPRHRAEDVTESTMMTTNQTDTSPSFATAGIPLVSMDSGGEISKLARMTSAMCRNTDCSVDDSLRKDVHPRPNFANTDTIFSSSEGSSVHGNVDTSTSNENSSTKTPATKKSKLDIISKTQPLPMKSACPY
ncbi:RING-type domain-containing protein [Trichostrongylus colubriformis]|uniref:RING-type domain-containing protein n=1 Tax=Trichostrongylus colubriformis TaxID=6319 RepID=A0AAN8J244_TRICO